MTNGCEVQAAGHRCAARHPLKSLIVMIAGAILPGFARAMDTTPAAGPAAREAAVKEVASKEAVARKP